MKSKTQTVGRSVLGKGGSAMSVPAHTYRISALCLVLAVIAVGCNSKLSTPTAVDPPSLSNSQANASAASVAAREPGGFSVQSGNAPAMSGPFVIRTETAFTIQTLDFGRGLQALQGADIIEFCGGTIDFDLADLQRINNPHGVLMDLVKGADLTTSVWPFLAFDCGLFTTTDPLAVGLSSIILNDNDFDVSGSRTNSFGWRSHGTLADLGGAPVSFRTNVRLLIDKNGNFKEAVSDIVLR